MHTSHRSHTRFYIVALTALLLLVLLVVALHSPTEAAQPGEELASSSGPIPDGQSITISLYSTGPANVRLAVDGGDAADSITLTLLENGTPVDSWTVQSGETGWMHTVLPSNASVRLENTGDETLQHDLTIYARDTLPSIAEGISTWSGVARDVGLNSAIQLDAPSAGLYRFDLDAGSGGYQLVVDGDHVRKTVVSGNSPSPTDTTYYLDAGTHTFTVTQDTASSVTEWELTIQPVGGNDSLPSEEHGAVLGGGTFFNEEWIPLHVASGQPVNVRIETAGATTDSLRVELYNGNSTAFTSTDVFGGEVNWGSSTLAAGANALHVIADPTNADSLAYTVTVTPVGQPAHTWSGTTYANDARPNEGHSSIRLDFPSAGLYTFDLSATSGRYQFMLDNEYVQKTIEASDTFTAFVDAGTHTLTVAQDPTVGAEWQVAVDGDGATHDSLPFMRDGGELGGTGNAFTEEWLPINVATGANVNLRIAAMGDITDSLRIELYNDSTLVYTTSAVYGDEVFWGTAALTAGANRLHIAADDANSTPMRYDVQVHPIATIPATVSGASRGVGLNSTVRLSAVVSGTYSVQLVSKTGVASVTVDDTDDTTFNTAAVDSITTTLRVPLSAGLHTFTIEQDPNLPRTEWELGVTLRQSDEPFTVTGVDPSTIAPNQSTEITLEGSGFQSGVTVELLDDDGDVITPTTTVLVDSTEIAVTVPPLPIGTYDVRATNPNDDTATLTDALVVEEVQEPEQDIYLYLPIATRN